MRYLQLFEDFTFRSPKKIYVTNKDSIDDIGGTTDTDFNKKMNSMLINELFDEIVVLSEMTEKECKDWIKTIKPNDFLFCHTSKPTYKSSERLNSTILYDSLNNRKDISMIMNIGTYNSKVQFHKTYKDYSFLPKTCFKKEEAYSLKYPIVCKPDYASCGIGIQKFNSPEELKASRYNFDVYSEYIDHIREFRGIVLDGKIVYIVERINMDDKNTIDNKKTKDRVSFVYIPQDVKEFPYLRKLQNIEKKLSSELEVKQRIYSIDFFVTPDEEIKVIECNSRTQLGPYEFLIIYKNLVDVPYHHSQLIDQVVSAYLKAEKLKYEKQIKKSLIPINYDYKEHEKSFMDLVNLYDEKKLLKNKKKF
jgi:hypothetical protein